MELLLFSETSYPRHPGGGGRCSHLMAAGLAARGHCVRLVSLTSDPTTVEVLDGVEVHRVRMSPRESTPPRGGESEAAHAILSHLERHVRLDRIDVIHDIGGFLSFFYPVELQLRHRYAIPLVIHFQFLSVAFDILVSEPVDRFSPNVLRMEAANEDRVQCFAVRVADQIICPSFEDAALVRRLYRPQAPVAVIPNPLDLAAIDSGPSRSTRERLGPRSEHLVLFGGRLESPMKGGDVVRLAFERLVKDVASVRLVLLGYTAGVRDMFCGLERHVTPLDWVADAREVSRILAAVDVVLIPSRYEPFGMMCSEAMASGVPVIARAVGGLREMVIDGWNGFLLRQRRPPEQADEMRRHLERILSDPRLARRLGENGRAFARKHFSMDRVAARLEDMYRSLPRHATRPAVTPPACNASDRQRYFEIVERAVPRSAGQRGEWPFDPNDSIEHRCCRCTRGRLAREALALVSLTSREDPGHALQKICPLGLIHRDYVNERQRRPDSPRGRDGIGKP